MASVWPFPFSVEVQTAIVLNFQHRKRMGWLSLETLLPFLTLLFQEKNFQPLKSWLTYELQFL